MAVDVLSEVSINRSCHEVARFAADPDNATRWYVNIKAVQWITPPPLSVGSQIEFVAHFLGRRLVYTYHVAEYLPDHKLVMRTAQGPFPMETTYEFTAASPSVTHMRLRNRGEPRGFAKVLAPFLAMAMRRANQNDLRRLKAVLERST